MFHIPKSEVGVRSAARPAAGGLNGRRERAILPLVVDVPVETLIAAVRSAVPGLIAVYGFGSFAKGTAGPDSDLDLAILARGPVDPGLLGELRLQLEEIAQRDVDLVDLLFASTVMRIQVVAGGKAILVLDEPARGSFEDLTFSMYARLNEERQAILEQVREDGSVYGR